MTDAELSQRLQALSETDPACCGRDPVALAEEVRDEVFQAHLDRCKALADERRLCILAMLAEVEELCACEIQAGLGVTHATVSHHMDRLTEADLVAADRRGRWVYYRLADGVERWLP